MLNRFLPIVAGSLFLLFTTPLFAGTAPSAEARAIIEELGLEEAPTPISEHPGWKPQRVLFTLLPTPAGTSPEYREALQKAAGKVELILVEPGKTKLSKGTLATVDGYVGVCTPALLKQIGPRMRWIHNYSAGTHSYKGVSDKQVQEIVFTNSKQLSAPSIAEHIIAMLLALTHNMADYHKAQTEKTFVRQLSKTITFGELKGKTMLVVGLDGVGSEIAWRAHGLGMRVIATQRSSKKSPDFVEYVGRPDELRTLAGRADVIANAQKVKTGTNKIFDESFFKAVKPGAIFLSAGRGVSTVIADLVAALESGRLSGAGLDVTDPEPLPESSPLWTMPNVIITPHISHLGPDVDHRNMVIALENLRRYVAGEPMLNIVDLRQGH